MKTMILHLFVFVTFLFLVTSNCLFAKSDSLKVNISVKPIEENLKSTTKNTPEKLILKDVLNKDEVAASDFQFSFKGASSGSIELISYSNPNDLWQKMVYSMLDVSFTIEANFAQEYNDDLLVFNIVRKTGTAHFIGTATQKNFGATYEYNFDRSQQFDLRNVEGTLQYSLSKKKITKLNFALVNSTYYPYAKSIQYANDTLNVQYVMPPGDGWWFTHPDDIYLVPNPTFDLGNQFPTASFNSNPTIPYTDDTVTFDASNSKDPDGGNPAMLAAQWDFGDGTTGSGKIAKHIYTKPGLYNVCLTIIDINNLRGKICKEIAVNSKVNFSYKDVGLPVNNKWEIRYGFKDSTETAPGQTIKEYLWEFGDGKTSTEKDPSHTYEKAGNYTVSLTVTNSAGETNKKTIENCISDLGFRPILNGWKFSNNDINFVWPEKHWIQFDYKVLFGNDPSWKTMYNNNFPPSSTFPDWLLFAETFGFAQSYINYNTCRKALEFWNLKRDIWGGSCFGFSITSLLFFNNYLNFNNEFPKTGYLYSASDEIKSRNLINKFFLYQWDHNHQEFRNKSINNTATATISAIIKSFNYSKDNIAISLGMNDNIDNRHSVVPYKIITNPKNNKEMDIYIYDNNFPGDPNCIIKIKEGKWNYNSSSTFFIYGLFNRDPISSYDYIPVLFHPDLKSGMAFSQFQILNSVTNDILISKSNEFLGYSLNKIYAKTSYGTNIEIDQPFNTNPRPKGYYVDSGEYKAILDNFKTENTSFSVFTDTLSFFYKRSDATISQKDLLQFGPDYLKVINDDETKKSFDFMCIYNHTSNEKVLEFNKVEINPKDTISFYFANSAGVTLKTSKHSSTYVFRANILTETKADFYPEKNVTVNANTTQIVNPYWDDINNKGVKLKVDTGSDGTIDMSLNLNNFTGTSIFKDLLLVSVYPNPSNGKFKIECGENVSKAMISVYDIYGKQIVNYQLNYQQRKWTSEIDLTPYSKGAYLLKIVTDKKVFEKIVIKN